MGMDYQYAGSASYPRFDRELCAIAEIFGGIKTDHLKGREKTEHERCMGYWFGFLSSDDSNEEKFVFPENTNSILTKWFNNIYEDFTKEETLVVWENISEHKEIKYISSQIWDELEELVDCGEGWSIG